jgi:hypothetical protein
MTPHHGDYYMPKDKSNPPPPSDFNDPVPVTFLSVSGAFLVVVACDLPDDPEGQKWAKLAMRLLTEALEHWGVGGKTAAGYGRLGADIASGNAPAVTAPLIGTKSLPFRKGDKVRATRIEDSKKGTMQFKLPGDESGVLLRPLPTPIEIGQTIDLWVVTKAGASWQLSAEPQTAGSPRPPKKRRG